MIRFNLEEFISQHVTKRDESLLKADLEKFNKQLSERLTNKNVLDWRSRNHWLVVY